MPGQHCPASTARPGSGEDSDAPSFLPGLSPWTTLCPGLGLGFGSHVSGGQSLVPAGDDEGWQSEEEKPTDVTRLELSDQASCVSQSPRA